MSEIEYFNLLEHSFATEVVISKCPPKSRLEFLSGSVFDFTTYDSEMDEFFAWTALEVCAAITDKTTFAYIQDPERHRWYLAMCNMPFFSNRIEWGTSIRGAWWDCYNMPPLESCGLWDGDKQVLKLEFSRDQWPAFMSAVQKFARREPTP